MPIYTRPAYVDSSAVMWYDVDSNNIKTVDAIVGGPEVVVEQFDSADAISANVNIAYDGVGSYGFFRYSRANENTTASGTSLSWAGNNGNFNTSSNNILTWGGVSVPGTWRQHGHTNVSAYNNGITIWKRIL